MDCRAFCRSATASTPLTTPAMASQAGVKVTVREIGLPLPEPAIS